MDSVKTSILRSDGSRRIFIGAALTSDGLRYGSAAARPEHDSEKANATATVHGDEPERAGGPVV